VDTPSPAKKKRKTNSVAGPHSSSVAIEVAGQLGNDTKWPEFEQSLLEFANLTEQLTAENVKFEGNFQRIMELKAKINRVAANLHHVNTILDDHILKSHRA
jgi:hypothetical protein